MEATDETAFQEKTLRGDVQNKILDEVARRMPCWVKMSEHEQRTIINSADRIAAELVREVVKVVAHRDFPHMVVSLGKWTVKEGIKLEVTGSDSVEEITKLASNGGKQAILVFASVASFMGSRAEPKPDKDQPDLPIHDPETGEITEDADGAGNALPVSDELPEPPSDEPGDQGAADEPDPEPAQPRAARGRRRALADADA